MNQEEASCIPDIDKAIRSLSETEWSRLRRVGQILSAKVPGIDDESLLFEALERTLSGRRRWNREAVDFVGHLVGVMRSIASHELERRGNKTVALTSSIELIGLDDPEATLSAEDKIRRLRAHFGERDDLSALQVLDAMELGCDGPTIRSQLSLNQRGLETIVRRIRRAAFRLF